MSRPNQATEQEDETKPLWRYFSKILVVGTIWSTVVCMILNLMDLTLE